MIVMFQTKIQLSSSHVSFLRGCPQNCNFPVDFPLRPKSNGYPQHAAEGFIYKDCPNGIQTSGALKPHYTLANGLAVRLSVARIGTLFHTLVVCRGGSTKAASTPLLDTQGFGFRHP